MFAPCLLNRVNGVLNADKLSGMITTSAYKNLFDFTQFPIATKIIVRSDRLMPNYINLVFCNR